MREPRTPRELLLRERFRDLRPHHIYWAHPAEAASIIEVPWSDERLDKLIDHSNMGWCYATDDLYLYVPARISFQHSTGQNSFGIGCGRARREDIQTVELSAETLRAAFGNDLGPAIMQQVQIWSVPNLGAMKRSGANHIAGIGTWGFWVAAQTEANALSALVGSMVKQVAEIEGDG